LTIVIRQPPNPFCSSSSYYYYYYYYYYLKDATVTRLKRALDMNGNGDLTPVELR